MKKRRKGKDDEKVEAQSRELPNIGPISISYDPHDNNGHGNRVGVILVQNYTDIALHNLLQLWFLTLGVHHPRGSL